ncbi:MAG: methyltransferase [Gudongella sp.]|nr:methyltransferase [Gudongella sp.]
MIVFLEKVRVKTIFSKFEPIITEPLELQYLKAILDELNIESHIIDPLFKVDVPRNIVPDLVVLTGYNTAKDKIIEKAAYYKNKFLDVKVMVGGVFIQMNRDEFRDKNIDYIVHSLSLEKFKQFIMDLNIIEAPFAGLDINNNDGSFIEGETLVINNIETSLPSRDFFYQHKHELRYLDKRGVALIKGSIGCPYNCSYCYCTAINSSKFIRANFDSMFKEISRIKAEYFWIVDDVLLYDRKEALDFIESSKKYRFKGEIIAYLRPDFFIKHKDLLAELKNAGLSEVICGFETPDSQELKHYNKSLNGTDYPEVIRILKDHSISVTALFMVNPDYGLKEFKRLNHFIWKNKIEIYTISIMTPLKGTKDYNNYVDKLIDFEPKHYDFLHLLLPSKLSKPLFYTLFYMLHSKLLFSKRIWRFAFKKKVSFKKKIWNFWAKKYDRLWVQKLSLKPTRDKITNLIQKQLDSKELNMIDIGCGPGELISQIKNKSSSIFITGVDFSEEMIKISKIHNPEAEHFILDVNDLDSIDKSYDILTCTHSLPYYKDIREILNKFYNKLNPEGRIYLAFASGDSFYDKLVLSFVKLTTGPAYYPSDRVFREQLPDCLEVEAREVIKKRWFMPTIAIYTLKGAKI